MRKKFVLKCAALAACVALAAGTGAGIAVNSRRGQPSSASAAGSVDVWSTYATEKIMRDVSSGYENVKFAPEINVFAAKGEYEGSQIILSPEKDLESVTFEVADLKSGSEVFSKSNIEVFYEKYVHVTKVYDTATKASVGWYPDALVPMDAIVKAGENKVKKGENQGIYIRFNVDTEQPAGVYEGTFTLRYEGESKQIPVKLEVKDFTISEETHSRSLFISEWQYRLGELDSTQAMLEKYINAGLEYRISPASVVMERSFDDEGINYYVEKAVQFMKNPKCTNVSLPFESATVDGVTAFNTETMKKILRKFVEASVRDGTDYIRKLGCHLVDEPQQNNGFERTKVMTTLFKQTKNEMAEEVASDASIDEQLRDSLCDSLIHLVGAITGKYEEKYADYVDVWCPQVDYCDSEADRALYAGDYERWWYTCISPRAPYPTYHTEDTLLSARAMSWMQAEYDVKGVLFWATNVYAEYDGSKYVNIEDFYEGNASRFAQVNGDGYLFYPGKKYGIDGPIGSLRLEAIRDGLEEYEILYALKQSYAQSGADASALISILRNDIYSGTKVATDGARFHAARETLYSLPAITDSDASVRITDIRQTDYNKYETTVTVGGEGYKVYNNGTEITEYTSGGAYKIYKLETYLEKDRNCLDLSVEKGSEKYTFELLLGGKATKYEASGMLSAFSESNAAVTSSEADASEIGAGQGKLLRLEIGEVIEYSQSIKFYADFLSEVSSASKKLTITFFMDGLTEDLPVSAAVYTEDKSTGTEIGTAVLKNGFNEIELSLEGLGEDSGRKIKYLTFTFGSVGPEEGRISPARTVYVKDFVLYNK